MTLFAAAVAAISGYVAHWYQKRKFLGMRTGKFVLGCILVIAMIISIIGQTQADPLDLYDEYEEYGCSETSWITETIEIA